MEITLGLYKNATMDQIIEDYFEESSLWPPLQEIIKNAIKVDPIDGPGFGAPRHWGPLLPLWCCEAAGGPGELTDIVSASWKLFHMAAQTLDNVADQDSPHEWWVEFGPGIAINVATGLIFAAQSILYSQFEKPNRYLVAQKIVKEFNRSLEIVCSGQHADLVQQKPGTNQWWEVAAAKSGEPFALACKVGTIIATDDLTRIEAFAKFGHILGTIVQIQDDVHDFIHEDLTATSIYKKIKLSSLPIAYALEVISEKEKKHLLGLLDALGKDQYAKEQIIDIVEETGAIVFIETKKDWYKNKAQMELDRAAENNASKKLLLDLLEYLAE